MPPLEALIEQHRTPSRALSLIAGYFNVTAVLNGVAWLTLLGAAYVGVRPLAALVPRLPWLSINLIASIAMQLRVGHLLHRRSREGGVWAVAALAPGIISGVMHRASPMSGFSIGVGLVGLALVALVWRELE